MPLPPWSISREWEIDAPLARVWEVVAHTDKLNRAIDLPPVQVGTFDDGGLVRHVTARLYGLVSMSWVEYPFEWVRDRGYVVQRDFDRGPLTRFRGGIEVAAAGSRTRVRIHAELTPRNALGRLALPLIGHDSLRKTWTYLRRALERPRPPAGEPSLNAKSAKARTAPPGSRTRADAALLHQRAAVLGNIPSLDQRVVVQLLRHLLEAGDEDVVHMRPYTLARRWQTERAETLRVFLHATRAGVLDLSWDVMCPNCRISKAESGTLAQVSRLIHCETCCIAYEANLDRYVELRFRVNPGVRSATDTVYCFGGPYSAPHVLIQQLLHPGDVRTTTATLSDEAHRVRVLRANRSVLLSTGSVESAITSPPAVELAVTYGSDGWDRSEVVFSPGPVTLRWSNQTGMPVAVVLERIRWDDEALTAAEVTALQEFRDLFGSEVLGPGQDIGIESVSVVFSDLKDSTRLYEVAGDAPAYGHVREHFDFVRVHVARHRGAIVKTIGDAVMAIFYRPEDAVRCCLEIQRDVAAFNAASPERQALIVKLGVHHGPAIAINANGRLDYFGRTVNVAARIARESFGGDVVLIKEMLEDARVKTVVTQNNGRIFEEWTSTLRGCTDPLTLCRIKGEDYNFSP